MSIPHVSDGGAAFSYHLPMAKERKAWPTWGVRLKGRLKHLGLTWAQAAEQLGIAEITLRSYASGKRDIKLGEFFAICEKFELNPSKTLFGATLPASVESQAATELMENRSNKQRAGLLKMLQTTAAMIDAEEAHGGDIASSETIEQKMPVTKKLRLARENMVRAIKQPAPGPDLLSPLDNQGDTK